METSDSECFESADEDLNSEEENTINKKEVIKSAKIKTGEEEICSEFSEKLSIHEKLKIDTIDDANKNSTQPLGLSTKESATEDVSKDNENNLKSTSIVERNVTEESKTVVKPPKKPKEVNLGKSKESKTKEANIGKTKETKPKLGLKLGNKSQKNTQETVAPKVEPHSDIVKPPQEIIEHQVKQVSPVIDQKEEIIVDDNLWDDEEIDWGKEEILNSEQLETEGSAINTSKKKPNEEMDMWDNDEWDTLDEQNIPKENTDTSKSINNTSWGSWGNWGVTSILNTATHSVSTLTNQVSQGLSTVLESSMGVPDPEELARLHKAEEDQIKQMIKELKDTEPDLERRYEPSYSLGFGNLVSGVSHFTKLVESTGTKVIAGGLDTLETIGKKTMEVLQDGDPGLKKKRAFLKLDQHKPVLSQVLREAKEKAEEENRSLEEKHFKRKEKNYETLFDDNQGLVHLEALEMLSRQCDIKLQTISESLTGDALVDMQETMDQVKELCELPDEDDEEQITIDEIKEKLESAVSEINIPITYSRLITTWDETEDWLNQLNLNVCHERELHQQAIDTLAQLTAIGVEQFHKTGELLLVKEHRSTADEADSLVQLTTTLTSLIGIVAAKFSDKLNAKASEASNKESVNGLITNVFFEAANSSSYIQDAFQLLIPVLQVGAV